MIYFRIPKALPKDRPARGRSRRSVAAAPCREPQHKATKARFHNSQLGD
jgi:hypothetical protein